MTYDQIKYLTPKEAAAILQMKESTLAFWRCKLDKDKQPPYYKIGNHVRYIEQEIHAWMQTISSRRSA